MEQANKRVVDRKRNADLRAGVEARPLDDTVMADPAVYGRPPGARPARPAFRVVYPEAEVVRALSLVVFCVSGVCRMDRLSCLLS